MARMGEAMPPSMRTIARIREICAGTAQSTNQAHFSPPSKGDRRDADEGDGEGGPIDGLSLPPQHDIVCDARQRRLHLLEGHPGNPLEGLGLGRNAGGEGQAEAQEGHSNDRVRERGIEPSSGHPPICYRAVDHPFMPGGILTFPTKRSNDFTMMLPTQPPLFCD